MSYPGPNFQKMRQLSSVYSCLIIQFFFFKKNCLIIWHQPINFPCCDKKSQNPSCNIFQVSWPSNTNCRGKEKKKRGMQLLKFFKGKMQLDPSTAPYWHRRIFGCSLFAVSTVCPVGGQGQIGIGPLMYKRPDIICGTVQLL